LIVEAKEILNTTSITAAPRVAQKQPDAIATPAGWERLVAQRNPAIPPLTGSYCRTKHRFVK
jgi:hypothetical protein